MRKREIEELSQKLQKLKNEILLNIKGIDSNIDNLNAQESTEVIDLGTARIIINASENILKIYSKDLNDINRALEKIDNGMYGICEMCDEPIDVKRLRAKPFARFCISCREIFETNKKGHIK